MSNFPHCVRQLFTGLRCGDLVAANSILQRFGDTTTEGNGSGGGGNEESNHVDPSVASVVSKLADLQQGQESIFCDTIDERPATQFRPSLLRPSRALAEARRQVADLYQRASTGAATSPSEVPRLGYRSACLAMLGGAESVAEAPEASRIVGTVEDYLYASLWHAIHLAQGDGAPAFDAIQGVSAVGGETRGGLRGVSAAVARLAGLVKEWGPSHFEEDGGGAGGAADDVAYAASGGATARQRGSGGPASGGWAFALPLLAAQQHATALAYLAEAGGGVGLLQACHLGVAMDMSGLSLRDFTLADRDGATREDSARSQETLLPMLVASYSASLQGFDVVAALKYLVLLRDKGTFAKEQVRLLQSCRSEWMYNRFLIRSCSPPRPSSAHTGPKTSPRVPPVRNPCRRDPV